MLKMWRIGQKEGKLEADKQFQLAKGGSQQAGFEIEQRSSNYRTGCLIGCEEYEKEWCQVTGVQQGQFMQRKNNSILSMLDLKCQWDIKGDIYSQHCRYGSEVIEWSQERIRCCCVGGNGIQEIAYYQ